MIMTATHTTTVSKKMKDGTTKKYTYQLASDYHSKKNKQERAERRLLKPQDISSEKVREIKDAHSRFGVSITKLAQVYHLSRCSVFKVLSDDNADSSDKMPNLHEFDPSHSCSSVDQLCAWQTAN
jgi:DNA-binding transcriptional regulator YiaG